jgi:anti-anti-sigma regulatory factor
MVGAEMRTREGDDQVAVMLCGNPDIADAAEFAASLAPVAGSGRNVIADQQGLEFIDSSGLAPARSFNPG